MLLPPPSLVEGPPGPGGRVEVVLFDETADALGPRPVPVAADLRERGVHPLLPVVGVVPAVPAAARASALKASAAGRGWPSGSNRPHRISSARLPPGLLAAGSQITLRTPPASSNETVFFVSAARAA